MAAAAKAAKVEARSKVTPKTAPVPTAPAGAETKKLANAAPKSAEPRKQEPAAMPASLTLDRRGSQLPYARRMRARKRRFLPKPTKTSQLMNPTTWKRPRKRQS
jgi:hypothetical protein